MGDKKKELIEALRDTYIAMGRQLRPVPFLGKTHVVQLENLYVEPEMEILNRDGSRKVGYQKRKSELYSIVLKRLLSQKQRIFILGDPGYGKSTTSIHLAHQWSKSDEDSPAAKYEILILLRLRQLRGIGSISEAIKRLLIGQKHNLDVKSIESIVNDCPSVLVIFESYDEYPEKMNKSKTWIMKVILGEIFQDKSVIITSRFVPKTERTFCLVTLHGFSDTTKDQYIRTRMGCSERDAERLNRTLNDNVVLNDFCESPLLFAMFAHTSLGFRDNTILSSVTNILRFVLKGIHSHLKNKAKDENVRPTVTNTDTEHTALAKLSCDTLIGKNSKLVWNREHISKELGSDLYQYYINAGILLEEQNGDQTEISFYHNIFGEWFVALGVATSTPDTLTGVNRILNLGNVFEFHYLFRFICGLNSEASQTIINFMNENELVECAFLCSLERIGSIEHILSSIRGLCSKEIEIYENKSKIKQRSVMNLLEIASYNRITIRCLSFNIETSFTCVDSMKGTFKLESGIRLPNLKTLERVVVKLDGRQTISDHELQNIIQYSVQSPSLEQIVIRDCKVPFSLGIDGVLPSLTKRNLEVRWSNNRLGFYTLKFDTGQWINGKSGKQLTDVEYQQFI